MNLRNSWIINSCPKGPPPKMGSLFTLNFRTVLSSPKGSFFGGVAGGEGGLIRKGRGCQATIFVALPFFSSALKAYAREKQSPP
jgi:hypothetical protein